MPLPVDVDLADERLWRGPQAIPLRPKTFGVLRCLISHPGRLLTKAELIDAVWGETAVSEVVLMVCIRELRQALGDAPTRPQFIETVYRRGYRFVGTVAAGPTPAGASRLTLTALPSSAAVARGPACIRPAGRHVELDRLRAHLDMARQGLRQIVFVTGEAGIGKTTLVDAFLSQADTEGVLWIGRGQCIEHYGTGEAYLPVLEALGCLARGPGGRALTAIFSREAPSWLAQMPGLIGATETAAAQRRLVSVTRERMLREMGQAIETLTVERLLVLVLEDLHWSDYSTLDLIASLARRRESARLLLIGIYRPPDALRVGHPVEVVKQELQLHGHCQELTLAFLTEDSIAEYLATRLPGLPRPGDLARIVHQRTEGNPLFMVNVVESWRAQGLLIEENSRWTLRANATELRATVPESLRQLIERHLDGLRPDEQRVLEAASVAGPEFSTAAVGAGLGHDVVSVEECCARLARRGQLLQGSGERIWPDGTVAGFYRFAHALYREVLYARVPVARRTQLHWRVGTREEAGYQGQVEERAPALAVHFERGADPERAIAYRRLAADSALRRHAHADAIGHLTRALVVLESLPETPARRRHELDLQMALGPALMATKGYGAPEVEQTYTRARELCREIGETAPLFPVLMGLRRAHILQAKLQTARQLAQECLALAEAAGDPALALEAHCGLGVIRCFQGEFVESRVHTERGMALYDAREHLRHALTYGDDPGVGCLSYAGLALWFLGYPDQAAEKIRAACQLAEALTHPFSLAYALIGAAWLHQFRREPEAARAHAEAAVALSVEHGFPLREAQGTIIGGWALAALGEKEEGIARIRRGLGAFQATGAALNRTYYLALLAETYAESGRPDEGVAVLGEAFAIVEGGGESWWEAELYRLRGVLLGRREGPSDLATLEADFSRALDVARVQGARSLELRAALNLARLWRRQGRSFLAHQLVAEVFSQFTEGLGTPDLVDAMTLLAELSPSPSANT